MKHRFALLILFFSLFSVSIAEAKYFVNFVGSRYDLDYKSVLTDGVDNHTLGTIELAGLGGGWTSLSPGNFGFEFGLDFLGTNSQNLVPRTDWGVTWYYRFKAKVNYTFSFNIFFNVGTDFLASFYQDTEAHYLGLGFLYGIGYRINDRADISINTANSSILFAGESYRTLRGTVVEIHYNF